MAKERTCYVVANSVQQKGWDGRFSHSNKKWAAQFEISAAVQPAYDSRGAFAVNSHPAVFDGFISIMRREYLVAQAPKQDKPSLYETMEKARSQVKPRPQAPTKPLKRKEPER